MKKKTDAITKQKVTATDVAKLAGVSKWTVSRAFTKGASISESSLKKVQQSADALGYRPNLLARSLTKKRTNMIGILVAELDSPNALMVFDELSSQLQKRGLISLVLNVNTATDYNNALSLANQFQVDGIIFLGTELPQEILEQYSHHIPLISLYRDSDITNVQAVSTDGFLAGHHVADLFISLGYRTIAYMAGPIKKSTGLMRYEGFIKRLNKNSISLAKRFEIEHYTRKLAFNSLSDYLNSTPPHKRIDAIFCESDILAIGVIDALKYHNVENSIAIIGFDDIDLASSPSYNLTTYRQPLNKLVSESVQRLETMKDTQKTLIEGEFILRQSHIKMTLK